MNKHWIIRSVLYSSLLISTGCMVFQPRYPVNVASIPQPTLPAPQSFQAVQHVIFTLSDRSLTGRGTLSLDRATRSFEFSCVTPDGVKIFDLKMVNDTPEVLFSSSFPEQKEGFAEAVAVDISRIYFDNQPANKDDVFRKGEFLLFDIDLGDRAMEYSYTGEPPQLVIKQYCGPRGVEARVDYTDSIDQNSFRYIGEAKLRNKLYDYELTIQTKELTIK